MYRKHNAKSEKTDKITRTKAKSFCATMVCFALLLSLCACFSNSSMKPAETQGKVVELVFPLLVSGEIPSNLQNVEDTLNDYVKDKIGASIRLAPAEVSTLESYYLLQDSEAQKVDFVCLLPAETELFSMIDAGVLMPLDELLDEYGSGIKAAVADVLVVGQMNGVQYLISQVKETYTTGTSLEFNAGLIKKYNLDVLVDPYCRRCGTAAESGSSKRAGSSASCGWYDMLPIRQTGK